MSEHHPKSDSTLNLKKKLQTNDQPHEEDDEGEGSGGKTGHPPELLEHPAYLELQDKLTKTTAKSEENLDKALRLQAEIGNMLRRTERDVANAHKFALEKFALELLPVIDNLERAVQSSEEAQTPEGVFEGVHLTLKLFSSVLAKFGIEAVDPVNQPFNPELHQAISTAADPSTKPGTVLSVMQKGYTLNGRLVRPALVVVSKA